MTRRPEMPFRGRPKEPEHRVVERFMKGRAGRALPFAVTDRPDMVVSTPVVQHQLVLQVKCTGCDNPIGAVFREHYTDKSVGLLLEAGRIPSGDDREGSGPDVEKVRLDREAGSESITLDCFWQGHGSADVTVSQLLRGVAHAERRKSSRRGRAKVRPYVLDVRCALP